MKRTFWVYALLIAFITALITVFGVYWARNYDLPFVSKNVIWSIGVFSGPHPLKLSSNSIVTNPVLTADDVSDVNAAFVADPFIIHQDGKWYMFFEVLNKSSDHGDVGLATSGDGLNWAYQRIVLDEVFHLSYPHVFEWEGEYYMIPEAHESNSVRLYKAERFPYKWKFQKSILKGLHIDPTIFRHNGRWWLFSATSLRNDTLRLYSSLHLTGNWQEHPESPLISYDASRARPAGRVLKVGEKLFRVTQDDSQDYGRAVYAFEIVSLDETQYVENEVGHPILTKSGQGWNEGGMHHVDAVEAVNGEWLAVVDGWRSIIVFDGISP